MTLNCSVAYVKAAMFKTFLTCSMILRDWQYGQMSGNYHLMFLNVNFSTSEDLPQIMITCSYLPVIYNQTIDQVTQ